VTAATAHAGLLETIETQRFGCELAGSPLYCDLLVAVKADVEAGGVSAELLTPYADAPFGDAVVLRFLAGLHGAVLTGDAPALARHYPSVGGAPGPTLGSDALVAIAANHHRIAAQLRQFVQTNESGRSAALIGGLIEIGRLGMPLRLLEIGSSSGLNLLADRYRYESGDGSFGPVASPLRFVDPWFPAPPDLSLPLVIDSRRGCDPAPIDPSTDEGRTLLRSFVWPDQLDRLARLDAALSVAAHEPPVVDQAGAGDWLAHQLAEPVAGRATVVVHSIMLQYLSPAERAAVLAEIEEAGERATHDAPVAWLRLEPGGDQAELRLTTWPEGETHLLARSSYHGPPVVWLAPAGGVLRPGPR
jgi:hypothetical protein